jgi:acetyl esterase/lipase
MTRRSAGRRVLSSLAIAVWLAGCSAGATPTPGPPAVPATPPPSATVAPSPSPVPTPPPAVLSSPRPVTVAHVPYTPVVPCATYFDKVTPCQLELSVYAPTSGGPWPLVVVVPGNPGVLHKPSDEGDYAELGQPLAAQGAVVVVAQYRLDIEVDGGYPVTFQDIACAIGVARKIGPTYKADPARVTLVGHSFGGWAAAVVALTPTPFTPDPGSCNPTTGTLRPDAFLGIDGAYRIATDTSAFELQVPSV